MAQTLQPIPLGTPITDPKAGTITVFFREAWQALVDGFGRISILASSQAAGLNAAVAATTIATVLAQGAYRVSWTLKESVADGVSSSLAVTVHWTQNGVNVTESRAAFTLDNITKGSSDAVLVEADADSDVQFSLAYASNTPGAMRFGYRFLLEQLV